MCTKENFGLSNCVNGKCECTEWGQGACSEGTCLPVKGQTGTSAECTTDGHCRASVCGDGIQTGIEQCDDQNTADGDGCSSNCQIEKFHSCEGGVGQKTVCDKMRVRKDFRDLTKPEKDLYIEAVNKLKEQGVYDLFVQTHAHLTNKNYAHGTSGFLPWHRKYLLEFENAIRSADPGGKYKDVTVPYWDWAEDTDLCSANGGCKTFHEKSDLLKEFGGPGSFACSSYPHGGNIDCSRLPTFNPDSDDSVGKGGPKDVDFSGDYQAYCQANCADHVTWGSTGAGSVSCSTEEKSEDGCKDIPDNAVGCVRNGPFAGWMSPEYPENKDNTKTCLSRGLNWEIASQVRRGVDQ